MKILITGASGFLGSQIVRKVLAAGFEARALCLPTDSAPALQSLPVEIVRGDVLAPETLGSACQNCQGLIHASGHTHSRPADRRRLTAVHVMGTANVVQAAQLTGVQRLVYISSLGVLGGYSVPKPVTETQPAPNALTQKNTYHRAKAAAEKIALAANGRRLEVISVLPGMLWGPGDTSLSSTGLVHFLFQHRKLYYPRLGGASILDVEDAAQGVVAALQAGRPGERYLMAGDALRNDDFFPQLGAAVVPQVKPKTVPLFAVTGLAWLAEAANHLGFDPDFSLDTRRLCGIYWWGDDSRARQELGFVRRYTWPGTLQRTVAWYQAQYQLKSRGS